MNDTSKITWSGNRQRTNIHQTLRYGDSEGNIRQEQATTTDWNETQPKHQE